LANFATFLLVALRFFTRTTISASPGTWSSTEACCARAPAHRNRPSSTAAIVVVVVV
jgi:hypothetical protein